MKIVQINAVYHRASTGRTCEENARFFRAAGHDCITVYGECRGDYPHTVYMGNRLDHKWHALMSRVTGKVAYHSLIPTARLLRALKKDKPDVVHLRVLHSNFISLPMLLRFLAKEDIPTVLTMNDCFYMTGKCCHYYECGCSRWQTACGRCAFANDWFPTWFFDRTAEMFRDKMRLFGAIPRLAVIGASDWIAGEAAKAAMFRGREIRRIYNGIDLSVFRPTESDRKRALGIEGRFMLLTVSSDYSERKGLSDYLAVAARMPKECVLVMVGNMPKGVALPDNAISIPATDSVEELVAYYNAADVLLQLTRQETFGKVAAEAISCGTPVIAYQNTANAEMPAKGCGICVAPDGDVDGALRAIEQMMREGKAAYTNACRLRAEADFDAEKNAARHIALYRSLQDGEPGGDETA